MASKYTHDVAATVGEYTDRSGDKKKRYVTVGKAFTDDQGRISIKMDAVPVGPDWSGWLSLYPRKDDQGGGQRQEAPQQRRPAPTQPARHPDEDEEEQVPF